MTVPHRKSKRTDKAPVRPSRGWGHRSWKALSLGVAALVAGLGLILWRSAPPRVAALPMVDWSRLEPAVARAIETQFSFARQHPRSGEAVGKLGALLRVYGFPIQAAQCLNEAQRLEPDNPRWPHFQSLLQTTDNPSEAIRLERQAVSLCGNQPEYPRWRLARMLAEGGDWAGAQLEAEVLLKARPEYAPGRLVLAQAAASRAKIEEAMTWARQCVDDPRTRRAAWFLIAGWQRRNGNIVEAGNASRTAAQLPEDALVVDPFEVEVAALRGDPRGEFVQGHALLAAGNLEGAEPLIGRLVRAFPEEPESWLLLGRWQLLRKQPAQAEQALGRHLRLDPQSAQGLFQLGTALLQQEKFVEAAEHFRQASVIKADFGPAYFNQGVALAHSGQWAAAIEPFRACLKHNPEHMMAYLLLADVHMQLKQKEEALKLLDQAKALDPQDPRVESFRAKANAL